MFILASFKNVRIYINIFYVYVCIYLYIGGGRKSKIRSEEFLLFVTRLGSQIYAAFPQYPVSGGNGVQNHWVEPLQSQAKEGLGPIAANSHCKR